MYEYRAKVVRWIDADTIVVDIDQGFNDWKHNQHLRLIGIDAPDKQPAKGVATLHARSLAWPDTEIMIRTHKDKGDKYGRWLVEIYSDPTAMLRGISINGALVLAGHAKPWDGQGAHP